MPVHLAKTAPSGSPAVVLPHSLRYEPFSDGQRAIDRPHADYMGHSQSTPLSAPSAALAHHRRGPDATNRWRAQAVISRHRPRRYHGPSTPLARPQPAPADALMPPRSMRTLGRPLYWPPAARPGRGRRGVEPHAEGEAAGRRAGCRRARWGPRQGMGRRPLAARRRPGRRASRRRSPRWLDNPAKTLPLAVALDAAGLDDDSGHDAAAGHPLRAQVLSSVWDAKQHAAEAAAALVAVAPRCRQVGCPSRSDFYWMRADLSRPSALPDARRIVPVLLAVGAASLRAVVGNDISGLTVSF